MISLSLFSSSIAIVKVLQEWRILCTDLASSIELHSCKTLVDDGGTTQNGESLRNIAMKVLEKVPYTPSLYCVVDYRGQLQTTTQYFLRNLTRLFFHLIPHPQVFVTYNREIVHLSDGGVVAIDWARLGYTIGSDEPADSLPSNAPIIILHHGLVGDSQSEYIYHLCRKLLRRGYRVGVMIARGCGGLPLHNVFTFAGRKSSDIRAVVILLRSRYPSSKLFWIGFSLGAASTLQYLEDFPGPSRASTDNSLLDAVMCVSPPWSFYTQPSKRIWSILMTLPLKGYMIKHRHVLKSHKLGESLSLRKIFLLKDIKEFNEACFAGFGGLTRHGRAVVEEDVLTDSSGSDTESTTETEELTESRLTDAELTDSDNSHSAGLARSRRIPVEKPATVVSRRLKRANSVEESETLQYRSVEEYYADCSAIAGSHLITTPTLAISSMDDPIVPHEDCPTRDEQLGPGLIIVKTKLGGHLAFPEHLLPLTGAWTDKVAIEWFECFR